jgi:septum site-determining protein MinD
MTSIRDANRVIGMLKDMKINKCKIIVNRIDYDMVKNGDMLDVEDIISNLETELIGIIPSDKAITISTNRGEPIVLNEGTKIARAYKEVSLRILGEEIPFENSDIKFVDVVKKFFASK